MAVLVHATAIVIGTSGLILIGPSGAGKSSLALQLMAEARRAGHLAALVSDDQVFIEDVNGFLIATPPPTIKGMIELYGTGIGHVETVESAVLHCALSPVMADSSTRIPEENQRWPVTDQISLPLYRIDRSVRIPFDWIAAMIPGFPGANAFQI
jgi:serine kinase of HPr protein (carbohydrate metabolism regulator)